MRYGHSRAVLVLDLPGWIFSGAEAFVYRVVSLPAEPTSVPSPDPAYPATAGAPDDGGGLWSRYQMILSLAPLSNP